MLAQYIDSRSTPLQLAAQLSVEVALSNCAPKQKLLRVFSWQ
jgi:hypothetical protein